MSKYKLTTDTITVNGKTLYQIEATSNFLTVNNNNITIGTRGGYIESEKNLSQTGLCWIYNTAKVYDNAKVIDDAIIAMYGEVHGDAIVSGNAYITGEVELFDNVHVSDNVNIYGSLKIKNTAKILDNAFLDCDGYILDDVIVRGDVNCNGYLLLTGNSVLEGFAQQLYSDDILVMFDYANISSNAELTGRIVLTNNMKL